MCWPAAVAIGVSALASGVGSALSGGDKNVTTTTTADTRTQPQKELTYNSWNNYINDFYGTNNPTWAKTVADIKLQQKTPEERALANYNQSLADQKVLAGVDKAWANIEAKVNAFNAKREKLIAKGKPAPPVMVMPNRADYLPETTSFGPGGTMENERKSIEQRTYENVAGQKAADQAYLDRLAGLDTTRLAGTNAALAPYRAQLTDVLNQSQQGTGYFSPVRLSFGGQPVASFVPRQNRDLANQSLGIGKESAGVGVSLADLLYNTGSRASSAQLASDTAHPINEAADSYTREIEKLMLLTNQGQQTNTTTGTMPGMTGWDAATIGLRTLAGGLGSYYGAGGGTPAAPAAPAAYGGNIGGNYNFLGSQPVFTAQQF